MENSEPIKERNRINTDEIARLQSEIWELKNKNLDVTMTL